MKHSSTHPQSARFRLPLSAVLLYLLLITLAVTGVTFSRYMAGTTAGDAARVVYMKDISITETGDFVQPNRWIITPGVDMTKNAVVRFEGSEMACYVFLSVRTHGWSRGDDRTFTCPAGGDAALSFGIESAWTFLSGDETGAVYYRIVEANAALEAPIIENGGRITVPRGLTRTGLEALPDDLSVSFEATAMQYHGFSDTSEESGTEQERAMAAWRLVQDK